MKHPWENNFSNVIILINNKLTWISYTLFSSLIANYGYKTDYITQTRYGQGFYDDLYKTQLLEIRKI